MVIRAHLSLHVGLRDCTLRGDVCIPQATTTSTVRKKFCLSQKAELLGPTLLPEGLAVECVVIALHLLRWWQKNGIAKCLPIIMEHINSFQWMV